MSDEAVAAVESRIRERHAANLAEARRHLEATTAESAVATEAYVAALDTEHAKDSVANARRTDAAYNRAISAVNAATAARHRVDELEDETKTEYRLAREREREVARRERIERERAEREASEPAPKKKGSATLVVIERGARHYPTIDDTGDGLIGLDRESLRILCKGNGLSVGGHKATIIERLRKAGVTA